MTSVSDLRQMLLAPKKLWRGDELFGKPNPVEPKSGVYAWYFLNVPRIVPREDLHLVGFHALLYIGIAPCSPTSRSTLIRRLRNHMKGDASRSTLRKTLGCLMAKELELQLRPTGNTGRLTFGKDGEQQLSRWMEKNAFACWVEHSAPWSVECALVESLPSPLNLHHNNAHPFYGTLSKLRDLCKRDAGR